VRIPLARFPDFLAAKSDACEFYRSLQKSLWSTHV
jgi:hypothetical protein